MKIRDKTPSAILNFFFPLIARIACPAYHLEAKKRHGRFKITRRFTMEKRTPSSLCAFKLVLYSCRFGWVVLLGSLAGLLSQPRCPFPKKPEDTGETHRFSIASVLVFCLCGIFRADFDLCWVLGWIRRGWLPIPVGRTGM